MTDKAFVLGIMRMYGKAAAIDIQNRAANMTGTELIAEEDFIPAFNPLRDYLNFAPGYICRSAAGNVVKLLQPYDSILGHPQQPEELPSLWGFYWSTDPKKAKPFLALSTSPYMTGDCCTYEGRVWRSGQDNNVWAPGTPGVAWEEVEV